MAFRGNELYRPPVTLKDKQARPRGGSRAILVRSIIVLALIVLAAVIGFMLVVQPWTVRDGTPDDRLLAGMQFAVSDAQEALDETGELPEQLTLLQGSLVEYQRLNASSIRLCAVFEKASAGQQVAHPYFDFSVELIPELATARPNAGRHCYDVTLASMAPGVRADAQAFRQLNAAATAVECAFIATGSLPARLDDAVELSARQRNDPDCLHLSSVLDGGPSIEYAIIEAPNVRLCADFSRPFAQLDPPMRLFDPRRQAQFAEFSEDRDEVGRRCYDIAVRLPEPSLSVMMPSWDEPIDVEALPMQLRLAATHDKRAIGDVVNVLRLARCAYTLEGRAPQTVQDAVSAIARSNRVASRFNCDWAPQYFADPGNAPVATYERLGPAQVQVCATFNAAWEQPLALEFYSEALEDWPTNQPELQRPITPPGKHCFTLRLTAIGSGAP